MGRSRNSSSPGAVRPGATYAADDELRARCERLLGLVSPALRVEPGLLRAVRRLLDPAATGWREAFRRESPELRKAVVRELRRWHIALALEIWLDEAMALLETGGGDDGVLSEDDAEAARDFALRLGRTLERGTVEPRLLASLQAFFVRFGGRRTEKGLDRSADRPRPGSRLGCRSPELQRGADGHEPRLEDLRVPDGEDALAETEALRCE